MPRCRAMTAAGIRCNGKAKEGGLCAAHARSQRLGKEIQSFYEEPKEETKSPTRPWDASDNPWKPDIFKTSKTHTGFRPKWTTVDRIERRLAQGFQVADARNYEDEEALKKNEEGVIDTTLVREGMILMEIPEELAQDREKYYGHKTDLQDSMKVKRREYEKVKRESEQSGHDMGLRMIR